MFGTQTERETDIIGGSFLTWLALLTAGAGAGWLDAELHERAGDSPLGPKALEIEVEFGPERRRHDRLHVKLFVPDLSLFSIALFKLTII